MIRIEEIEIYPTTRMFNQEITAKQQIEEYVDFLIDDMHYGRRIDVDNLEKLFQYTIQEFRKGRRL